MHINRTNEPGTCPWCGRKLPLQSSRTVSTAVRNPNYEKEMREWEEKVEASPPGSVHRRVLELNPPQSILHEHRREKVPAVNAYAPFCRLRCGLDFAIAAHKNGFRLAPYNGEG